MSLPVSPSRRDDTDRVLHAERDRSDATVRASFTSIPHDALEDEHRWRSYAARLDVDRALTDRLLNSERVSADDALASRDAFLAMVSHDLRGMAGIIGLNASLIESDAPMHEETRGSTIVACANDIRTLSARMLHLIEDLTDFVQIESGQMSVVLKPVDAVQTLRHVYELFRPLACARELELGVCASAEPLIARLDAARISQVLANLVGNAIKFVPPGGHVVLSVERCGEGLAFTVCDDGPGIAAEHIGLIFDRFWQGARRQAGLGLGLYICKQIVESHGGRIEVLSEPGRGTKFTLYVPAS